MLATILFDLDGTILDTNELIITSFLHALEGQTPEPVTREILVPNMGRPLIEQMKLFTGRESVEELVAKYREFNISKHDEMVKEFPHVKEVLFELGKRGIRMGVVTSKVRRTSEMGLALCGLTEFMGVVVTVGDVAKPKPDPEGIRKAIAALGADKPTTLMVGDSHYDIEAAHNAGIRAAGVAWSLKGEEHLRGYKPEYILRDMRELLDIVDAEG